MKHKKYRDYELDFMVFLGAMLIAALSVLTFLLIFDPFAVK